jgi:uncharacterized membrane protein
MFIVGARGLSLAALVISTYLTWASLSGGGVAGCGPESGCDRVLSSQWSKWLGLPVSVGALGVYTAVFAATFRLGSKVPAVRQQRAWEALVFAAVLLLGAALWFIGLQLIAIRALCPYCMAAHMCGLCLALLILFHAPFRYTPSKLLQAGKGVFVGRVVAARLTLVAVGGVLALIGGQVLHPAKTFQVKGVAAVELTVDRSSPAKSILTSGHRGKVLQLYGGAFQFDLQEVPLLGSPEAPRVMVCLFDYSCRHCRIMHGHLKEVHRAFSNQLAIVSLVAPLHTNCNKTIRRVHPDHTNACEYARIALAVWRADRRKMEEFEDWVFAPVRPPAPEAVRQHAAKLVGVKALERAERDPWVSRRMQEGVNLLATNYLQFRRGTLPQLMVGTNIIQGELSGPQDLYSLLSVNLGLTVR